MKAKEMFEILGYEFNDYSSSNNEDEYYAIYVYEIRHKGKLQKEIAFYPNTKKVEMYAINEVWELVELKAINMQLKELGWIE